MFNIDWHGMLKIEYDNGWLSYDKLKLFVGWNELTKDQFTDITGKNYDTGSVAQVTSSSTTS
ncbi:XkdX family protein [Lentilactobacillus sp. G22-6]|nr:XkdX family protein [Lentilactobacillus dabitei]MBU9788729.1 XkdX family protein [Lentilactobacillus dabitei]